jgi:carbonic anhydrase
MTDRTSTVTPTPPDVPETPSGQAPKEAHRTAGWSAWLRHDLPASFVVFLIAVPLSLGIALATGAPPQAGLIAAAVGGLVVGGLGGVPLQVSGPTASLTVVVAGLIGQYGWEATCAIVAAAGALQVLLGTVRAARTALLASPALVHGLLTGIGVTIVLTELHVVLGGRPDSSALRNLAALPGQVVSHHPPSVIVGLLTIVVLIACRALPTWARVVPAPLLAALVSTAVTVDAGLPVERVQLPSFGDLSLPAALPHGSILGVLTGVVTIAAVGGLESLLSATALDATLGRPGSNLDRELLAQGSANLLSGLLGGLPVAGVAVRSTANVQAGATGRVSAMLHGLWVLVFAAAGTALLRYIPLPALAGLVTVAGFAMVNRSRIRHVHHHREFPVYVVTVLGVVLFGVVGGVGVGAAVAALTALLRLAGCTVHTEERDDTYRVTVRGALTFLAVPRLGQALARAGRGRAVRLELDTAFVDHAAYEAISVWRTGHISSGGTAVIDDVHGGWSRRVSHIEDHPRRSVLARLRSPRLRAEHHHHAAAASAAQSGQPVLPARRLEPWSSWQQDPLGQMTAEQALVTGVGEFHRRAAPSVRPVLDRLATDGQRPTHLFLTCSDSRVVPDLITSSGPGDLFTVRNIGNLAPRHGLLVGENSVAAAVLHAVETLGVRALTVSGHSSCCAMQALLTAEEEEEQAPENISPLHGWLRYAQPSLARLRAREPVLDGSAITPSRADLLSLANVAQQLDHLGGYPVVRDLVAAGELELIGIWFELRSARVYRLRQRPDEGPDTFETLTS